jgi:hypothetical protein
MSSPAKGMRGWKSIPLEPKNTITNTRGLADGGVQRTIQITRSDQTFDGNPLEDWFHDGTLGDLDLVNFEDIDLGSGEKESAPHSPKVSRTPATHIMRLWLLI